jgi:CBS domain containing-hemolysin-like protein
MDDIVEEIVGEINDDFSQDDVPYFKIDNSNYIFEGKSNLNDLFQVIDIKDQSIFESKRGDSETLAGFVLEQIGFFPKKGYSIKVNNILFTINEVDRKRIKKIKVSFKI